MTSFPLGTTRIARAALYGAGMALLAAPFGLTDAQERGLSPATPPCCQTDAQMRSVEAVNGLPRYALVIGNSSYAQQPLKNPGNDAKAIAYELQKMGFSVTLVLDATRGQMLDAVRTYSAQLGAKAAVGLFYYAGHGVQYSWRNYLIPVDAKVEKPEDVQTQTVALSTLLDGLVKARNPMNVIVLDACRDAPFGDRLPLDQKGLSQFDAPSGSLLAYSTAPGTVALDGEGVNGLYTAHLLQEMRAPGTRLEDVLKRVRLNVRLKSQGRQIPWESTSLEQDFFFQPPKQLTKLTMEEMEAQFERELDHWQKIRASTDPVVFEEYLRLYPSGKFSELAQFRIDRLLQNKGQPRLELTVAPTPFSAGSAAKNVHFRVGEEYSYREIDMLKNAELRQVTHRVKAVDFFEVIYEDGTVTDRLNNPQPKPGVLSQQQTFIQTYSVGKSWSTRYRALSSAGTAVDVEYDYRIVRREEIDTAAGSFDAFRVEGRGRQVQTGSQLEFVYWMVPNVRRYVAAESKQMDAGGRVVSHLREEITNYVMLK